MKVIKQTKRGDRIDIQDNKTIIPEIEGQENKFLSVDENGELEWREVSSGGGDLLSTNNLSDVEDIIESKNNLEVHGKFLATEDLEAFVVVTSTGKLADSGTLSHRGKVIGITLAAVISGFIGNTVGQGMIKNTEWDWTIGDKIFLNGITLSTVAPSSGFSQQIGVATASDTITVNLGPVILL